MHGELERLLLAGVLEGEGRRAANRRIAADLGISVSAVRLARSRVLRHLRTEFEGLLV
jgi:FixJ family two-component response regulator